VAYSSIATGRPLTPGQLGLEEDYRAAGGTDWDEISGMFDPYNPYERREFTAGAAAETADLASAWELSGKQLGEAWGLQRGQLESAYGLQQAQLGETWGLKRGELGAGTRSGLLQGGRAMSAIGRGGLAQSGQATEMGLGALRDIRQQYGRGMQAGRSAYEQAMAKGEMSFAQKMASGELGYGQKMATGELKLGQAQRGIARGLKQDIYGTEQEWERSQRDLLQTMIGALG